MKNSKHPFQINFIIAAFLLIRSLVQRNLLKILFIPFNRKTETYVSCNVKTDFRSKNMTREKKEKRKNKKEKPSKSYNKTKNN